MRIRRKWVERNSSSTSRLKCRETWRQSVHKKMRSSGEELKLRRTRRKISGGSVKQVEKLGGEAIVVRDDGAREEALRSTTREEVFGVQRVRGRRSYS